MIFDKKKDKKKKKKLPTERFLSLKANGNEIEAINFSLCRDPDDTARLEVRTKDVCEAMHYDHVDFELTTSLKRVKVSGNFREARNEKKFKVYIFTVTDYSQFFI